MMLSRKAITISWKYHIDRPSKQHQRAHSATFVFSAHIAVYHCKTKRRRTILYSREARTNFLKHNVRLLSDTSTVQAHYRASAAQHLSTHSSEPSTKSSWPSNTIEMPKRNTSQQNTNSSRANTKSN